MDFTAEHKTYIIGTREPVLISVNHDGKLIFKEKSKISSEQYWLPMARPLKLTPDHPRYVSSASRSSSSSLSSRQSNPPPSFGRIH